MRRVRGGGRPVARENAARHAGDRADERRAAVGAARRAEVEDARFARARAAGADVARDRAAVLLGELRGVERAWQRAAHERRRPRERLDKLARRKVPHLSRTRTNKQTKQINNGACVRRGERCRGRTHTHTAQITSRRQTNRPNAASVARTKAKSAASVDVVHTASVRRRPVRPTRRYSSSDVVRPPSSRRGDRRAWSCSSARHEPERIMPFE